jgi:hypothetical protein
MGSYQSRQVGGKQSLHSGIMRILSDNISSVSVFPQNSLFGEQAFHPSLEAFENNSNSTNNALSDNTFTQLT